METVAFATAALAALYRRLRQIQCNFPQPFRDRYFHLQENDVSIPPLCVRIDGVTAHILYFYCLTLKLAASARDRARQGNTMPNNGHHPERDHLCYVILSFFLVLVITTWVAGVSQELKDTHSLKIAKIITPTDNR